MSSDVFWAVVVGALLVVVAVAWSLLGVLEVRAADQPVDAPGRPGGFIRAPADRRLAWVWVLLLSVAAILLGRSGGHDLPVAATVAAVTAYALCWALGAAIVVSAGRRRRRPGTAAKRGQHVLAWALRLAVTGAALVLGWFLLDLWIGLGTP
ncbi:hypothetical protein [Propionicicella superfundia]|uniref:hypothetical protein n=1 Tax=Propionicicella superfundia TaxID=348582 RepID=UPI0004255695|nr:hypothetical protein [Propionicicella superfundia]